MFSLIKQEVEFARKGVAVQICVPTNLFTLTKPVHETEKFLQR